MYDMTVTDGTFMLEPNYISKVTLQKPQKWAKIHKKVQIREAVLFVSQRLKMNVSFELCDFGQRIN